MTRQTEADHDLVVTSNFIHAARDAGYTNLAYALAELIDNSLQAMATVIEVDINRPSEATAPTITVRDNGHGMNRAELAACLKFGGSSRFNDRQSFGRYGMGLPAASLSQARQVTVSAWQAGGPASFVVLNVDQVAAGNPASLTPRRVVGREVARSHSGCEVIWSECDRIEYQRLGWLERSLTRDLGRMFRSFLRDGIRLRLNERDVAPHDPMFLSDDYDGARAANPFDALSYELPTQHGGTSIVLVRFSELPVRRWHRLDTVAKRRLGIVGGAGVSILRARREISYGWHLFGGKRRENYDDWWRCEIEFEPALDELFGITNNKQGVRPTATLRRALEPDLESMARLLNGRVRQAFEAVKVEAQVEHACHVAESVDDQLPIVKRARGRGRRPSGRLSYRLKVDSAGAGALVSSRMLEQTLEVTLNSDHAAFTAIYAPLLAMSGDDATEITTAVQLLFLSMGRAQAVLQADRTANWQDLPTMWSDGLAKMLRKS